MVNTLGGWIIRMLHEILEEIENLQTRLKDKYIETKSIQAMADINAVKYVEDIGFLNGLEYSTDEIVMTYMTIENLLNNFLENSIDGQYKAEMDLLKSELELSKNKITIQDKKLKAYKKMEKNNVVVDKIVEDK